MKRLGRKHKLSFSLLQHVLLLLCDRFNDPLSKLGSYNPQNEYTGLGPSIELHHIYRTLDYLAANNDIIQTPIYNKNRNLFNYELDIVFYDVTTFYFQSEVQQEGALRQMGFAKDGKIGNDLPLTYCTYAYNGRTIIRTWSEKRSKKDKAEREERVARADKLLDQPSSIKKSQQLRYQKYR